MYITNLLITLVTAISTITLLQHKDNKKETQRNKKEILIALLITLLSSVFLTYNTTIAINISITILLATFATLITDDVQRLSTTITTCTITNLAALLVVIVIPFPTNQILSALLGGITFTGGLWLMQKVAKHIYAAQTQPWEGENTTLEEKTVTMTDKNGTETIKCKWTDFDDFIQINKAVITLANGQTHEFKTAILSKKILTADTFSWDFNQSQTQPLTIKGESTTSPTIALGHGDILIGPAMGFLAGWSMDLLGLITVASLTGTTHALILLAIKKAKTKSIKDTSRIQTPFLPHLCIAATYILCIKVGIMKRFWIQ